MYHFPHRPLLHPSVTSRDFKLAPMFSSKHLALMTIKWHPVLFPFFFYAVFSQIQNEVTFHKKVAVPKSLVSLDRLANIVDPLLDHQTISELISYHSSPHRLAPLEMTLCSNKSRILRKRFSINTTEKEHRNQSLSDLAFRLLFLGIHHHQHRHALNELQTRHDAPYGVKSSTPGVFNYECPSAKFLVSAVPGGTGLGHAIRKIALETIKAAMLSDRVALFLNSARVGPKESRRHWTMASCPRHDFQCFFMPLSPCTITEKDLQTAPVLTMEQSLSWGTSNHSLEKYNSSKVVVMKMHSKQNPTWLWQARIEQVMESIHSFVESAGAALDDNNRKAHGFDNASLNSVKAYLERAEKKDPWIFDHAMTLYVLRPNPTSKQKIQDAMQRIFPSDFDPASAIGMPIRSSDKCNRESECLSFDEYMHIVQTIPLPEDGSMTSPLKGKQRHVILTTESIEMLQERHKYNANQSFPFRLIANDQDVAQGTGNPKNYNNLISRNITADDIMLSTITSLTMQLMASSTIGNCCSNFHKLMLEFLSRGCGAAPSNNFECLQDNKNPEFRLCCQWSKNQECKSKRAQ